MYSTRKSYISIIISTIMFYPVDKSIHLSTHKKILVFIWKDEFNNAKHRSCDNEFLIFCGNKIVKEL